MQYKIKEINRIVELDDELVNLYTQFAELRDSIFVINIYLNYGNQEIDDDKLSKICNETLVEDLENMKDNALVVDFIQRNKEKVMSLWHSDTAEIIIEQ